MDRNTFPIVWNAFFLSSGREKWGSGGEETSSPPRLQKREVGVPGEGFLPPPGVVSVHINVCQRPHRIFGGGVRKTHELGEGAEPPPAVRPPNPLRSSFCRIPFGLLILTDGAIDGNLLPIVWNAFWLSSGTEKWGSGGGDTSPPPGLQKREVGVPGEGFLHPPGVVSVHINVCQLPHRILGGGVRKTLKLGEGVVTPSRGSAAVRRGRVILLNLCIRPGIHIGEP